MAEYEEEEYYEDEEEGSSLPAWLTETPYWAISAVAHLILVLLIGSFVLIEQVDKPVLKKSVVKRAKKKPEYDPTKKRDMVKRPEILEKRKEKPIVKLKPDEVTPDIPKGVDENKLTNKNLLQDSVNDAFGVGGGAAGAYGNRFGKGSLTREGGSEGTEEAVLAALHWLRRHQHPDGYWSADDFFNQCKDPNSPCKAHVPSYTDGRGFEGYNVGVTALAMLAYLGYGHTHVNGEWEEFREVMRKAMNWMLKQQIKSDDPKTNGVFGKTEAEEWVYNHSIATMAMAELLFISRDRFGKLPKSVEEATKYILRAQNDGYGWKYEFHDGKNDTSVTGWMVLALKAAKTCSQSRFIKVKKEAYSDAFTGAIAWFERTTSELSGITGYQSPGDPGSSLRAAYPDPYPFSKDLSCMTAVSVLCRLFAGQKRRDEAIKSGVKVLMKETPQWREAKGKRQSKINIYYWYYGSYAMFQFGGSQWKEWNDAMQEALLPTQRVGGCEDGSWDPIGEWGAAGGRVYATAIGAMTLEVYYRFVRQKEG